MTDQDPVGRTAQNYSAWAVGWISFASVLMTMIGVFQVFAGLTAIVNDEFFVGTRDYTFRLNATAWGWIHLGLGVLIFIAGLALLRGSVFAGVVGVALASLSAVVNFLWLPYYPFWSIIMIALAVAVIWALTVHGRDIALNDT
jgi:hypothetical protein